MPESTVTDSGYRITDDDNVRIRAVVTWPPLTEFSLDSEQAAAIAFPANDEQWRVILFRDRELAAECVDCVNRDMAALLVHWWAGLLAQVAAVQAVAA